jgi:hypothetical protein
MYQMWNDKKRIRMRKKVLPNLTSKNFVDED